MSISKIQRERKIKEFTKELVEQGVEPNNFELNNRLRAYFDNHVIGMPYYSPIKQIPYEVSSKDDYNHNFLTFKEDIETAYDANIEANNKAVSIQEYYDTEKSKVFHAIDKIVLRANTLEESIKTGKRIQEYVEVFDSLYNLELYGNEKRNIPYTTSFIDLLQKRVYTEKSNSQINKLLLSNAKVAISDLTQFSGYQQQGSLNNILRDTFSDVFVFSGQSYDNTEKTLTLVVDLGSIMSFNTVLFRSTSSNDMTFSLALSEDGDNFYNVYDADGKDLIEWNFNVKEARYIRIACTKNQADGINETKQGSTIYEYYYIIKNISLALEHFEETSTIVTKPIEFNNLTNFIKLDAKDVIYGDTRIDYFIGFDNNTDKVGWDAIENHKEHQLFMFEKQYKIANYGVYPEYGSGSDIYKSLYKIYRIPDGVNLNSLKVVPGYNMWSIKRYNRNDGDYNDGFSLLSSDISNYTNIATPTQEFMDCEDYNHLIDSNVLYLFTQYINAPRTEVIDNLFMYIAPNDSNEKAQGEIRIFLNGYEQTTGDNGMYAFNIKKGVNKIQIAVYSPSDKAISRTIRHNFNFRKLTNEVYGFKPMKYTNPNMLSKSLEENMDYYTVVNNIIYVNSDPVKLTQSINNDMGYMISYYALKPNMQKYFSSNKLRFRIMAILRSKNKNLSPSIINFRITGK